MDESIAPAGRSMDIELGGQEVITIDLENLDPNPEDVLDLLKDGGCKVWIWTKLAGEYWRRGYLDAAERIAQSAVECFETNGSTSSLPPVYALLSNIKIANARQKPKIILPDAQQDVQTRERPKDEYYKEAASFLNKGERASSAAGEGVGGQLSFLTRGIHQLATQSMDDALRSFEGVLSEKQTNVIALLGKARILYARRLYKESLKCFQQVLTYNPSCSPDPRIGIGLCQWALGNKTKATQAWQRSMEVNPSEWPAQLLVGLEAINSSKNTEYSEKDRVDLLKHGTDLIQKAFKANQRSAAAANALCEIVLRKGQTTKALKLAERTVQFADTKTILNEGYIRAARALHIGGSVAEAMKYYSLATPGQTKHLLGAIGLAQAQLHTDEVAAAIHTLDTLLGNGQGAKIRSPEAMVMLAALRANPRPGVSGSELVEERKKARDLFDNVFKEFTQAAHGGRANGQAANQLPPRIANDVEMHVEIARLWQKEDLDRTHSALQEALRISETNSDIDPRLLNNVGALRHINKQLIEAQAMYERALTIASSSKHEVQESTSTTILYNLARIYEEQGQETLAKDAYDKLISRHPEYVDAKIRMAQMLANISRHNEAHDLIKQCLASQEKNLNLRAYYTYFLIQSNLPKVAKEFVFSTLKDHDKHDIYSLCAAGWIQYHQARESRDNSSSGIQDRKRGFQRAAEFFEKALHLDNCCAFAAQGLAIITAEDALGSLGGTLGAGTADEAQKRTQNALTAMEIFAKVSETMEDQSVHVNIGHCYFAQDDFDRAIENYETAAGKPGASPNVNVLLCLCRSWYSKAMKDQSLTAMTTALRYAQRAFHVQPHDKAIMYNIAMIQQKSAEMLFSVPPNRRLLEDLQRVIEWAAHAQRLFASLASDPAPMVPYNRDIADQRRKYGENMLKKGDEHLASQRAFDEQHKAYQEAARRKRQEEKEKQEQEERLKAEAKRLEDMKLAEERRLAREKAMEWSRDIKMESDEEREKRPKKQRKPKPEAVSGDEGGAAEPKKKRRGKLKKATPEQDDGEEALFSGEEDGEALVKKRIAKKRVVRDDDDEEAAAPKRKQSKYKSREVLSDTDEEMS